MTETAAPEDLTPQADTAGLRLDSDAAKAWLAVYDHASRTRSWHPADVEWALGEAHRLLRRLGGRIGPSGGKGFWPAMVREAEDYGEQSKHRRVLSREVSSMNAALGWCWAYLEAHENERRALNLWCLAKERGAPYARLVREVGRARTTENFRRQRALLWIAAGLCRADVAIPHEVFMARLERAASDMRDDRDALAVAAQTGEALAAPAPEPVDDAPAPAADLPSISDLWVAAAAAHAQADIVGRADAVLGLIFDRVRQEAAAGACAPDAASLNRRRDQLAAEAQRRRLLTANHGRRLSFTRAELSARVNQRISEANEEQQ